MREIRQELLLTRHHFPKFVDAWLDFWIIHLRNKTFTACYHQHGILRGHVCDEQRGEKRFVPLAILLQRVNLFSLLFPELVEADLLDLRHTELYLAFVVFLAIRGDGFGRSLEREQ